MKHTYFSSMWQKWNAEITGKFEISTFRQTFSGSQSVFPRFHLNCKNFLRKSIKINRICHSTNTSSADGTTITGNITLGPPLRKLSPENCQSTCC